MSVYHQASVSDCRRTATPQRLKKYGQKVEGHDTKMSGPSRRTCSAPNFQISSCATVYSIHADLGVSSHCKCVQSPVFSYCEYRILCLLWLYFILRLFRLTVSLYLTVSRADGRPPCINGDIAIQWELSNFDPSQYQNPLTDYDKTLHN